MAEHVVNVAVSICVVVKELKPPTLLGEVNSTARLTCMAVWTPELILEAKEDPEPVVTAAEGTWETLITDLFLSYKMDVYM